jgi:hypothetical protein
VHTYFVLANLIFYWEEKSFVAVAIELEEFKEEAERQRDKQFVSGCATGVGRAVAGYVRETGGGQGRGGKEGRRSREGRREDDKEEEGRGEGLPE